MQLNNYLHSKVNYLLFFCFTLLIAVQTQAQRDFNKYTTLLAEGPIPEDFTITTEQKVKQDMLTRESKLTPTNKRIFVEGIHRSIDPILHSGSVIYGDEITAYVEKVANNLLKNDPTLRAKLRFYTIKSNAANALSTDQGIIFITTGLIAQLTSEAQLAYVLSHEIVHFTEKHVSESFALENANIRTSERIETLSAHAREYEFEADKLALKLYYDAGYADAEIVSTFDVLMYSYLPFDEVPITRDYFSSESFYIPDNLFSKESFEIKREEDYDDDRSSHPNIRKRKDAVIEAMDAYDDRGTVVSVQDTDAFLYIRTLARFESVRTDVLEGQYAQALYSVFLLEKEFPQSVYLQQIKAHAWLGVAQLKEADKLKETLPLTREYEGESAALYYFLGELSKEGTLALATRIIYDTRNRFPEDTVLAMIQDRLIRTLAKNEKFSWADYSDRNFHESAEARIAANNAVEAPAEVSPPVKQSKYDKIRNKKNPKSPESFDSTKFYRYGLADITADSVFREKFTTYRNAEKERKLQLEALASTETKKEKKEREKGTDYETIPPIDLSKVIVVEPISTCVNKKDKQLPVMEDHSKVMMQQALTEAAKIGGVEIVPVSQQTFKDNPETFNQRNLLYSLIEQTSNLPDNDFVPVDYDLLLEIEKATGTSDALYTTSDYYYASRVDATVVIIGIVCYPLIPLTLLVYLPIAVHLSHNLETSVLVMDITTGEVEAGIFREDHGKPKKSRYKKVYMPTMKHLSMAQ